MSAILAHIFVSCLDRTACERCAKISQPINDFDPDIDIHNTSWKDGIAGFHILLEQHDNPFVIETEI